MANFWLRKRPVGGGGGDVTDPMITSASTFSVAENTALAVTITTDEDSTIAIVGGDDAEHFEIVQVGAPSTSATLRFFSNGTKNYESPDDANADNAYSLIVRATDEADNFSQQSVTITVTDLEEGPATVPVLNSGVVSPIGRATKVGAGTVPLSSDTLGLLENSGSSAITGWEIRQIGGAAQWKDPVSGVSIGASFIAANGTPVPSGALTPGNTATFEVQATNADGTSSAVTYTHQVQSAVDARDAFNVSSQSQLTAVAPSSSALDHTQLSNKELWLPRGVKTWETAQLLLRRIRCTAGNWGYVRNADESNPCWVRDVKVMGSTSLRVQGLKARADSASLWLFWATTETAYTSENIEFLDCTVEAITKTEANSSLPNGFKIESTRTGKVQDCTGEWINGGIIVSSSGTTHVICDNIDITGFRARRFRNNGIFLGGTLSVHVVDNINISDCILLAPTQKNVALHMDVIQFAGTGLAGTISDVDIRRVIGIIAEGVGIMQGQFARSDNGNIQSDITIEECIFGIGASWAIALGRGDGRFINRNTLFFMPGVDGRTNGYVTMEENTANIGLFIPTRSASQNYNVGEYVRGSGGASDQAYLCTVAGTSSSGSGPSGTSSPQTDGTVTWEYAGTYASQFTNSEVGSNFIQDDLSDWPASVTLTNNYDAIGVSMTTLAALFPAIAGLNLSQAAWAALSYSQVEAALKVALAPLDGGALENGDGTYTGALFPDGTWNDGTAYAP